MRIGIEAGDTVRGRATGVGRYTSELIKALLALDTTHELTPLYPRRRWLNALRKPSRPRGRWYIRGRGVRGFDLVHATGCVFPGPRNSAEVATLHDLYALTGPGKVPTAREIEETTGYLRRGDRVICVSAAARRDLHRMTDLPESRSVVIHHGVSAAYRPRDPTEVEHVQCIVGAPPEYLLFVGRPRETKNLERLVRGYARSGVNLPLLLGGAFYRSHRALVSGVAEECGVAERVRCVGYVRERHLPALLTGARGFAFPSVFEGFGLPVLEAMACGTPVLTSRGVATEEAAGGHAVLVDPWSIDDIADGINRLLEADPEMALAGSKYARRFTWERAAKKTLEVYERVLI